MPKLSIGTRSLLYGAHQFILHPAFVAAAWTKLYGFPCDPRLWVSFFVHDIGYIGSENMDGPEGELHVALGAMIMTRLFGREWGSFCFRHSRFAAASVSETPSRLCMADKLAVAMMPSWLYLPLVRLTGEIDEYMAANNPGGKYASMHIDTASQKDWFRSMAAYLRRCVAMQQEQGGDHGEPR